jgi:hypothetical protein
VFWLDARSVSSRDAAKARRLRSATVLRPTVRQQGRRTVGRTSSPGQCRRWPRPGAVNPIIATTGFVSVWAGASTNVENDLEHENDGNGHDDPDENDNKGDESRRQTIGMKPALVVALFNEMPH